MKSADRSLSAAGEEGALAAAVEAAEAAAHAARDAWSAENNKLSALETERQELDTKLQRCAENATSVVQATQVRDAGLGGAAAIDLLFRVFSSCRRRNRPQQVSIPVGKP